MEFQKRNLTVCFALIGAGLAAVGLDGFVASANSDEGAAQTEASEQAGGAPESAHEELVREELKGILELSDPARIERAPGFSPITDIESGKPAASVGVAATVGETDQLSVQPSEASSNEDGR